MFLFFTEKKQRTFFWTALYPPLSRGRRQGRKEKDPCDALVPTLQRRNPAHSEPRT
jgi:hypothetical protein